MQLRPNQLATHLKQPLATFITDVEFGIISWHGVPPGECHPPIIGAGPYTMHELTSTEVRLDANPHYPTPPKMPHVVIKFVKDDSARMLMMAGGSVDLLQNARPDLVDDIAARPRVRVQSAPSVILTYMMLNNDDPALRDHRVREAIALAIDRRVGRLRRLHREQHDENHQCQRDDIVIERRRREFQSFDCGQHRDRRRNHGIADEHRGADHAKR